MPPEKTPRERAEGLIHLLVPDWRPTPRQLLWAIRLGIVLSLLVAIGYAYEITLWDWIKLLIVPAVIAAGAAWFNSQQRDRELQISERHEQEQALQAYFAQLADLILHENLLELTKEGSPPEVQERLERLDRSREELQEEIARQLGEPLEKLQQREPQEVHQRLQELVQREPQEMHQRLQELAQRRVQQDEELQDYLQRQQIELAQPLMVARTFTRATLRRVDGSSKGQIIEFLHETGMLRRERIVVYLHRADLSHADLSGLNLAGDALSGANLSEANLSNADLSNADLDFTFLHGAKGWTEDQLSAASSLEGASHGGREGLESEPESGQRLRGLRLGGNQKDGVCRGGRPGPGRHRRSVQCC